LGQGRENSKAFLKENPEIADEITKAIQNSMGIEGMISCSEEDEGEE
ncbi:DNA recombination/repair protein RecA, partial [Campylobacter jejuni]